MRLSRRARVILILTVLVAVLGIVCYWAHRQISYSPFALRACLFWYLVADRETLRYCFVPIGATEAEIRATFGDPDYVLSVSASEYQNHIEMRRRTGSWTLPSRAFTDRAVLYLEATGGGQMEAYYFIDDNGRLAATFISED